LPSIPSLPVGADNSDSLTQLSSAKVFYGKSPNGKLELAPKVRKLIGVAITGILSLTVVLVLISTSGLAEMNGNS